MKIVGRLFDTFDSPMRFLERLVPFSLVIASVIIASLFAYLATVRTLTGLENILFQVFALGTGLTGSFIFGRQSARTAAREMIEPHARSAFRRLISLYDGLSRMAKTITGTEDDEVKLKIIEAIVVDQISTADDALADWRDVVPEAVAEITKTPRRPFDEEEGLRNG